MGEICPKTKSYPLSLSKNSTPSHIMVILRRTPLEKTGNIIQEAFLIELFFKLNLIILCFIYQYFKFVLLLKFFILLNYDAMPCPPECIKFYIQPPLSLVVIFSYAPSNFPTPPLQVIIAVSLIRFMIRNNAMFPNFSLISLYWKTSRNNRVVSS